MGVAAKKTQVESDQDTINEWMAETGAVEVDMTKVAQWGMQHGYFTPKPHDPVREYAKRLSRAARQEQYTDPQGREVRKKHCYTIIDETGQRCWRWTDITTGSPDKLKLAFQHRRRAALGDIVQLAKDVESFNDNNSHGVQLEFDFNFNEDLAEMAHPTEYPDD